MAAADGMVNLIELLGSWILHKRLTSALRSGSGPRIAMVCGTVH